jgi:hypothetical protein
MARLPPRLPFHEWLDYLFGHAVGPSGFRESDDWWDEAAAPELAVDYLTRLFEAPEVLLDRYPEDRVDRGFWFLVGESGHLGPLFGPAAAWETRRRGLLAIGDLYERLFAVACANHLGHRDGGPAPPRPLNSICYMWWDLFPTRGGHGGDQLQQITVRGQSRRQRRLTRRQRGVATSTRDDALGTVDDVLLAVMARTLRVESEPCREGALHGLGHWHRAYPERTAAIIGGWLAEGPQISPELRQYAMTARRGCVQ